VVGFRDTWVVAPIPRTPTRTAYDLRQARLITLTTCSELFHTDNRMIAFGHLVATRGK